MSLYVIIASLLLLGTGCTGYCPSLCQCKTKAGEAVVAEPSPIESLRLKCGGSPTQLTELKEIDLSNVWTAVISL